MKQNILDQFRQPLSDLGNKDIILKGIYSPLYDQKEISRFMTSHYESTAGAQSQAESFDLTNYYDGLMSEALKKSGFSSKNQKLAILDVGCGFGSTTFPLLKLFPKAQIVASELSVPMLLVLKQKLDSHKDRDRVELLQLNAEELDFKDNSFDLVVGAAILHHLFNPEKALKDCAKILKPGGITIFFEPFSEGMSMMALIYEAIIHHSGFKWLDLSTKLYFRHSVSIWQKMKNQDKTDPFFQKVDDKWLFERDYFQKYAQKYQFKDCLIYRLDQSPQPFMNLLKTHLSKKIDKLPKWIFGVIENYETWLSKTQKDELIIEGCIILRKK